MVDAGRILIMPKGIWSNLVSYEMLDLVTQDGVAYLARQASVGVSPKTDENYTYWQPFGSATLPDGTTIIYDSNNNFTVNIDGRTIVYDSTNDYLKVSIDNDTLKYDSTNGYLYADVATDLANLTDVTLTNPANGNILRYNSTSQKWENYTLTKSDIGLGNVDNTSDIDKPVSTATNTLVNNKHKVTTKAVNLTGWTSDTTSQSGTTLYKKSISLSHVYVDSPTVDIGAASGSVLPTTAQQEAYDLLQYCTVDGTTLYLYASDIPTTAFYINVEGVD